MRDSENNEVGVLLTDKELCQSPRHRFNQFLLSHSAFYRSLSGSYARRRVDRFDATKVENPIQEIGLPDIRVGVKEPEAAKMLWRRVSDEERRDNLEELLAISERRGIELVLIHPSYRQSVPHECILTSFAALHDLAFFETQQIMHERVSSSVMYLDVCHPSAYGHEMLAKGLAREIQSWMPAPKHSLAGES
jgi:hypothetical protein